MASGLQVGGEVILSARRASFAVSRFSVLHGADALYREAVRRETWAPEALSSYQLSMAVALARYAMVHSPFYRDLYTSHGVRQADLAAPESFFTLPVVERADVRDNFERFRTLEYRHGQRSWTRGSTGEPLHLLRDTRVTTLPLQWRLFRGWGIHPCDDVAIIWGDAWSVSRSPARRAHGDTSRRIYLDAYDVAEGPVRAFVRLWRETRPALLTGDARGVLEFARMLRKLDLKVRPPRAVATTALALTEEEREEIGEVLGAPVYDYYSSAEVPWMGGECAQRSGHHIFADHRVVEVVDEHGVATSGSGVVVVTDLGNRVFPLIRYRVGDSARPIGSPCGCGSSLPRIDRVVRREKGSFELPGLPAAPRLDAVLRAATDEQPQWAAGA